MWGQTSSKKNRGAKGTAKIESLIGQHTELRGDVEFSGGLHVDGTIKGNVIAAEEGRSVLSLSERGTIEGEVRVPNVVINGTVIGDVHALEHIELATQARVTGNVYYSLIEMAMGAEVNGNLVHCAEGSQPRLTHAEEAARKAEVDPESESEAPTGEDEEQAGKT
ncbi:protein CcmA, bactofilin family [Thiohalospira halophila DSM 15071]|uniref:Protein CcmA, bactofilin family n=1 Tax=Thiohalospira halophila DSM 15071 TaxID=1123397 RepID=A0A1I1UZN2_9GAMM|nr:polymer-forming cytoskeletal protein [Thiohalospira halophila]SFD74303.1 protein CcmA, bactofilin family [Thiohalospira halophila DSM 15071]